MLVCYISDKNSKKVFQNIKWQIIYGLSPYVKRVICFKTELYALLIMYFRLADLLLPPIGLEAHSQQSKRNRVQIANSPAAV
jgi:hypothetical protein